MKTAASAIVCVAAISTAVFAQQRAGVRVLSKEGRLPISSATVVLKSKSSEYQLTSGTGNSGECGFAQIAPGSYELKVSADGYYPATIDIVISPRVTPSIEVELTPKASVTAEITVRGDAETIDPTQASTVVTLGSKEVQTLPAARRAQLSDIVTRYVSSAVAGHDNLVHLRGNELSLNTFINGVSFFDNPHQLFTPGLSPDVIQSMNVITGGFPAEFGNRFGGILDVVTRSGFDADNHGSLMLGAGRYLRHSASADYGGHTKRFGYFFYAQGFESQRFLNTPQPRILHDLGRAARGFAQFDYRPSSRDMVKLVLAGAGSNFELPNTPEDELVHRDFFQRNREQTGILNWEHLFSDSSALSTSIYQRISQSKLVPTSDPFSIQASSQRDDLTIGIKSDYSLYSGATRAFKAGADLMLLRLREDASFDPRRNRIEIDPFSLRGRKTGGEASAYVQDQVRLTRSLTANLGLRYDQYSVTTSGHAFSPRINLAYSFDRSRTVLHFAYNRFFSPPPIENLLLSSRIAEEGRPPQISRSNHLEAGVSHSLSGRFTMRLTSYWRSDDNSFETTEVANVRLFVPTTFARGKAFGVEFSGRLEEIRQIGLSARFGYTAQRALQTGPVSGGFTVEQAKAGETATPAFDQIHTATGGVHWRNQRSGVWADASFEYGSGTPASIPNAAGAEVRVRLPQHLVLNVSSGIDLFRKDRSRVSLQFDLENVTNRIFAIAKESEFTPVQFYQPRFVSGSLKVSF